MSTIYPLGRQRRRPLGNAYRLLLLAGLLAGLMLRVFRLGAESLWYDETVSAYLARQLPAEIIRHTAFDIHPPGYYLMLHLWHQITEPSPIRGLEYLLGWSSVAWGMLTVALLYPIGCRLLGKRVALLAIWLAALNPFHIWYSQEVRMYTMGSALGLLCLWAALRWLEPEAGRSWGYLIVYVVAAAFGMYTLYYFALLLIAINVIALLQLWKERERASSNLGARLMTWLMAQVGVLLLFMPWLPIFWRQALEPPVPPWRVPWENVADLFLTVNQSLAALLVGQTPPASLRWPWAILALAAVFAFLWKPGSRRSAASGMPDGMQSHARPTHFDSRPILLTYTFLPIALLYLASMIVTPLYHVRYLFLYAPPFMLIVAAAILNLSAYRRTLGVLAGALVLLISFAGLQQFWFNPAYQADDHRRAVVDLANNWRPGDLILVNAGWAYTAVDTYWPRQLKDASASIPPPILDRERFNRLPDSPPVAGPVVAVTGSVDGAESLGWGDARSDFFAVSAVETVATLEALTRQYERIWHYRIYDTVSDPEAVIRQTLAHKGRLVSQVNYPGRDYLQAQLFEVDPDPARLPADVADTADPVDFGDVLRLGDAEIPVKGNAGEHLYVDLIWVPLPGLASLPADLKMSLRLYDANGALIAQQDDPPSTPTSAWPSQGPVRQPLVLPVPASTKPGTYSLELVVYRQDDGLPLPLADDPRSVHGQRRQLGAVEILPASPSSSALPSPLTRFDSIELVDATLSVAGSQAGDAVMLDITWRPGSNAYQ